MLKRKLVNDIRLDNLQSSHFFVKLAAMLEALTMNYGDRVFSTSNMRLDHHRNHFEQQRKRIAYKLKNSRILRITFKTFRHFKGTMEYYKTKDIPSRNDSFRPQKHKEHTDLYTPGEICRQRRIHFKGCSQR